MTVKENVLAFLEKNKGNFISGNNLAKKLKVSRNAIWKAINSLKSEGYKIESLQNKGYCLSSDNYIPSSQSIAKYLNEDFFDIEVLDTVDSTNDYLRRKAESGIQEGHIVISKEQTKGKGRLGKDFFSPSDSGIYLSILLKPKLQLQQALYITTCAAVATSKAIDHISNKNSKIKWVNDIFIDDKKVCGILTEASFDLEGGGIDYAILGIGLNLTKPVNNFPKDIKKTAGYIFDSNNSILDYQSKLIAEILNNFFYFYENIEDKQYLTDYKNKSLILGKPIYILRGKNKEKAIALDIDDEFKLKIQKPDSTIEYLSSGDVSIRKKS